MNSSYHVRTVLLKLSAAAMLLPFVAWSAGGDDSHDHAAPAVDAQVDFGVLPTAPLGPPPCLQTGGIGGPADPCAYKLHHLTPEEVSITEGGQITFQVHGGGHGIAIYRVSKKTTRDTIGQFLCPGVDPHTLDNPALHTCNLSATNANAAHIISDAKGAVVISVGPNVTNAHPDNRLWSEPGRLASAYRFLEKGRYLVICMNRTHSLNDWMFGFVNVAEEDDR
jgi:hypothetical protein